MSEDAAQGGAHRIPDIRTWRGHTAGLYGLPHYPSDPPIVTNNKGWWRDVDALLNEVDRLRLALEESADFRCYNENRVGDPCACCEHVIDLVDATLGTPKRRQFGRHIATDERAADA